MRIYPAAVSLSNGVYVTLRRSPGGKHESANILNLAGAAPPVCMTTKTPPTIAVPPFHSCLHLACRFTLGSSNQNNYLPLVYKPFVALETISRSMQTTTPPPAMLHLQSFSTVVPPLATPLRDEYLDVETFSSSNASIFVYALAWLQTLLGFLSSLISLIFFHFSHPPSPESESTISPPPQRREPSDDVSPFVQSWVQDRQLALIASQCELMLEEQEIAVASQGTTRPIPIRGATVAYMAPTPLPTRDRTHSVPDLLAVPFSTLPSHSPPTLTRQNSAPCALSTLVPVPGARRFSLSSVESEGIVTPLDEDVDDVKSTLEYVDELIREAEAKEEDRLRNLSEKTGFRRRLAWHVKSALHL